jgi:glutamate synthase domain-containing protein 1
VKPIQAMGPGILLQIPHAFLSRECGKLNFQLPPPPDYAVGMVFLPREHEGRVECEELFEKIVEQQGQRVLGWRTVPTDDVGIGPSALASRPLVRQIFIGRDQSTADQPAFERKLYVIRKLVTKGAKRGIHERGMFYVCSLSSRTVVYKGMLTTSQLTTFYPDLCDPELNRHWRWFIRGSARTPFPAGRGPILIAISLTTERSTPCAAT